MRGFVRGAGYLGQGFAFLRARPGLYLLGVLPGLLVFLVLAALYVVLVTQVGDLVSWATPFADDWSDSLRGLLRVLLAVAVLLGALLLASSLFVGLTLTVGDPFYERIWRAVEVSLGDAAPESDLGFLRSARDAAVLTALGAACSVLVIVVGFVPLAGPVVGAVLGVVLTGRLLARELLSRPLEARGLDGAAQRRLVAPHRRTVMGFGVATQLCFLVPLGAVVVMPAAVAGATLLARRELAV